MKLEDIIDRINSNNKESLRLIKDIKKSSKKVRSLIDDLR